MIISNHIDEPYLLAQDDILHDYINQGGVIFTLVEKSLPWLNCVSNWKRSSISLKDRALEVKATDNGLFENIKVKDLEIASNKDVDLMTDLEAAVVTVSPVHNAEPEESEESEESAEE